MYPQQRSVEFSVEVSVELVVTVSIAFVRSSAVRASRPQQRAKLRLREVEGLAHRAQAQLALAGRALGLWRRLLVVGLAMRRVRLLEPLERVLRQRRA